jgi:hypothetical protein
MTTQSSAEMGSGDNALPAKGFDSRARSDIIVLWVCSFDSMDTVIERKANITKMHFSLRRASIKQNLSLVEEVGN